jgi:hypothetical protein
VAALIGLYEEQACIKLGEIFDALFKPSSKGKDGLDSSRPAPPSVASVTQAGRTLSVKGDGFSKDSKVLINGKPAKATEFVSSTQLNATLNDGDTGSVTVTVSNPTASGNNLTSPPFSITLQQ